MKESSRILLACAALVLGGCASQSAVQAPMESVPAPILKSGESWIYAETNPYNRTRLRTVRFTLEARPQGFELVGRSDRPADPVMTETIARPWEVAADSDGAVRRTFDPPLATLRFPLAAGTSWKQAVRVTDERGRVLRWSALTRAIRWERVATPAGEFVALRVEREINTGDVEPGWNSTQLSDVVWYVPEVGRWVRWEHRTERVERSREPRVQRDWRLWELVGR
ncbi:MAG TPA: hypothetical protein VEG36_07340 [Burkholderiales bacterium]|nr:hypothetical protein [Burkholderiales bacterium]